jgi:hypothetical protein
MNSEKINDWLQVVGMVGIMASLIFVGVQVRQTQRVGEGQEAASFLELSLALRTLQLENIEVWRKVCSGEELEGDEQHRGALLFKAYLEFSYIGGIANQVNMMQAEHNLFAYRFAANLHRYPGFAKIMEANNAWSQEGEATLANDERARRFSGEVVTRLAELKELEPNPDYDLMWCGV